MNILERTGSRLALLAAALAWILCAIPVVAASPPLARQVAVVFNSTDPDSEKLARHYAKARQIPDTHLIGLECPTEELVSREVFDSQISQRLREILVERGLLAGSPPALQIVRKPSIIRYLVLVRGIPLKIAENPALGYDPDAPVHFRVNAASVDSELALLHGLYHDLTGPVLNPVFDGRTDESGATITGEILKVFRLDGAKAADVQRVIDETLEAEKTGGLAGRVYIDKRGIKEGPYKLGDDWLDAAGKAFEKAGWDVEYDENEGLFPYWHPLPDAAVYLGWYAPHIGGAPARPDFRFRKGAIAYHLHSASAVTLHDEKIAWCAPLVSKGAAITMGAVNEPYLHLTPDLGILAQCLLQGWNAGDSAYASEQFLSWQIVFLGDPLYVPAPREDVDAALARFSAEKNPNLVWLQRRKANLLAREGKTAEAFAFLESCLQANPDPLLVDCQAGLHEKAGDIGQALKCHRRAGDLFTDDWNRARTAFAVMRLCEKNGDSVGAADAGEKLLKQFPTFPGRAALLERMIKWTAGTPTDNRTAAWRRELDSLKAAEPPAEKAAQKETSP